MTRDRVDLSEKVEVHNVDAVYMGFCGFRVSMALVSRSRDLRREEHTPRDHLSLCIPTTEFSSVGATRLLFSRTMAPATGYPS